MGFVTVACQFVDGQARTVSDGLEGKNFRRRKVTLCPTADWAQLPNTLTVPKEVCRG